MSWYGLAVAERRGKDRLGPAVVDRMGEAGIGKDRPGSIGMVRHRFVRKWYVWAAVD